MNTVYLDFETYSNTPIGYGTYRYAADADVLLMAFACNDGAVQVVDFTVPVQREQYVDMLKQTIERDDVRVVIHNSMFDRVIAKHALGVDIPPEKIDDTMIIAAMHALPMGLEALCGVFNLPVDLAKSKEGKRLIRMFCSPAAKSLGGGRTLPKDRPQDWEAFKEYAKQDVVAMRELYKLLPKWNYKLEQPTWVLDQKINDRGFKVDVALAKAAVEAVAQVQDDLAIQTQQLSGGLVGSATQRDALLQHLLLEHGVALPDMTKSTLERRVNDPELPAVVRELLAVRLDASTTSTSKYTALLEGVNKDGRLRGTLQAYGAGRTARWAGRKFQPQNLPRPTHTQEEIDFAIDALLAGCLHLVSNDTMKLTSSCIRSAIIADEGKTLAVADLSNIEGRVAAWLAGEAWKVKAFADFDAGQGHDLYALAYARSFGVSPETVMKNKKEGDGSMRQIGKVQELALGYGGGVGAFVTMAAAYKLDLADMAKQALPSIPNETLAQAQRFWDNASNKYNLAQEVFVVCDAIKRLWRASQQEIASYWWELEDAVRNAVANPKEVQIARKLKIVRRKNWLLIFLPSGRALTYPGVQVDEDGVISYMGNDSYTRQWKRIKTYGGKLFENICQATARDVLAANMPLVESKGFEIVLTCHDELVTETALTAVPTEFADAKHPLGEYLARLMATNPPWAEGLPLAAGGFQTTRYRKG